MENRLPHPSIASIQNYIGGKLCNPTSDRWIDNIQPATGIVYGRIAASDRFDVEKAVDAAQTALNAWSKLPPTKRSDYLLALANLMERDLELLAAIESFDNGKPLHVARMVDIPRSVSNIRFFATAILHIASAFGRCGLHFTLEPASLPVHLENCSSPRGGEYSCGQTL
jgi:aminomuconate-semialdehyde/2-hydroxymuconate-6-semialdehyde dehydrogenase